MHIQLISEPCRALTLVQLLSEVTENELLMVYKWGTTTTNPTGQGFTGVGTPGPGSDL